MSLYPLKRAAAPGVDGETWQPYGEALEGNPAELYERLRLGAHRAKPVQRAYIPKAGGGPRPLGNRRPDSDQGRLRGPGPCSSGPAGGGVGVSGARVGMPRRSHGGSDRDLEGSQGIAPAGPERS